MARQRTALGIHPSSSQRYRRRYNRFISGVCIVECTLRRVDTRAIQHVRASINSSLGPEISMLSLGSRDFSEFRNLVEREKRGDVSCSSSAEKACRCNISRLSNMEVSFSPATPSLSSQKSIKQLFATYYQAILPITFINHFNYISILATIS